MQLFDILQLNIMEQNFAVIIVVFTVAMAARFLQTGCFGIEHLYKAPVSHYNRKLSQQEVDGNMGQLTVFIGDATLL